MPLFGPYFHQAHLSKAKQCAQSVGVFHFPVALISFNRPLRTHCARASFILSNSSRAMLTSVVSPTRTSYHYDHIEDQDVVRSAWLLSLAANNNCAKRNHRRQLHHYHQHHHTCHHYACRR